MMMMMKEETTATAKGGSNSWTRVCDTCRSAASTVYCRADSAFLCAGCDAHIHAANRMASRHERVWLCESCERAPAAFICKADAASLCTSCDADVHSANPLARRHQRVPVLPLPGPGCYGPPSRTDGLLVAEEADESIDEEEEDEDEAASWLLINPSKNKNQNSGFLFSGEVDEYLELVEYNSSVENHLIDLPHKQQQQQQCYSVPDQKNYGGDSVVPVQFVVAKEQMQRSFQPEMSYESLKAACSYNPSISQSVSVSSMDMGIVPESTMSDISITHPRGPPKGTMDLFTTCTIQVPTQLTPMDREARVLRYREKKKMRKFEKTIRYASRKAYAEIRPRIKGRFAKRTTDAEFEVDQMFSNSLMVENGYGVVPSF